ncbi:MAG: Maf family nucleotide pyrophosphatase [Crocinitomicaceae bacterium]|nr:Maf family nucleotide pyrophosphatase [Crocinitomicaceae bacterium]
MDNIQIVLGSKSPRRQALIKELRFPVEVRTMDIEEVYPSDLPIAEVPEFLSKLKAEPFANDLRQNELLVTSDTVVLLDNQLLGKPKNETDAKNMLRSISGKIHTVVSGVCLTSLEKQVTFSTKTEVHFSPLEDAQIDHYVKTFSPFDKAGSYAIQEWIGFIGVKKINGCYYNVMGLPLHDLYRAISSHFLK